VTWAAYGSILVVAVVLVLMPGPDFAAVVTKNTLARPADTWLGQMRNTWLGQMRKRMTIRRGM
jgi:threonine/homoserine/homoserine lactone efflux protein